MFIRFFLFTQGEAEQKVRQGRELSKYIYQALSAFTQLNAPGVYFKLDIVDAAFT